MSSSNSISLNSAEAVEFINDAINLLNVLADALTTDEETDYGRFKLVRTVQGWLRLAIDELNDHPE